MYSIWTRSYSFLVYVAWGALLLWLAIKNLTVKVVKGWTTAMIHRFYVCVLYRIIAPIIIHTLFSHYSNFVSLRLIRTK